MIQLLEHTHAILSIKNSVMLSVSILHVLVSFTILHILAFSPIPTHQHHPFALSAKETVSDVQLDVEEWKALTDDGGVKMRVLLSSPNTKEASDGNSKADVGINMKGKDVTVEYIGSIAARNWTAMDIVECWLPDQGLPSLAPELFKAFNINGTKLTGPKFSKKFIFEGLGIIKEAKIQTLYDAAQSIKESEMIHVEGTVFDKNQFTFRVGKGMSIRAFDFAVQNMKVGETVALVARCDYAYGSRGLRSNGKFLVPPYATVQYDLTLINIK